MVGVGRGIAPLNLHVALVLVHDRETAYIKQVALHDLGAARLVSVTAIAEDDNGYTSDGALEELLTYGGNGVAYPLADRGMARLVDGGVVEARLNEGGAGIEGAQVEERVGVGGEEGGEGSEVFEVSGRHVT